MGSLINISTTGLRLFLNRTYEEDELLVDDMIHVAFTVGGTIYINTKVKVRYIKEKVFGAEFRPPLDGQLLEDLARWVFQKREEDLLAMGRSAGQGETVPSGEVRGSAALVLVSSSNELGDQLSALLASDLPPLRRLPQTIQSARDLASAGPALVLFHVDSTSWETRRRLKALAEALPATLPIVALGTGVDSGQLAELGTEIRAVWSYPLQPTPGSIFPRLLRGIFRKHFPD